MLWGNKDNAANSVLWAPTNVNKAPTATERDRLYGNTTVGSYFSGAVKGQVGIDPSEVASNPGSTAGWNLKTTGTGSIASLSINTAGSGYANTATFVIAAPAGGANATGNVVTNAAGNAVGYTLTNAGSGFTTKNPTVVITGGGTGAAYTATAGGRAGRVHFETLVASTLS